MAATILAQLQKATEEGIKKAKTYENKNGKVTLKTTRKPRPVRKGPVPTDSKRKYERRRKRELRARRWVTDPKRQLVEKDTILRSNAHNTLKRYDSQTGQPGWTGKNPHVLMMRLKNAHINRVLPIMKELYERNDTYGKSYQNQWSKPTHTQLKRGVRVDAYDPKKGRVGGYHLFIRHSNGPPYRFVKKALQQLKKEGR